MLPKVSIGVIVVIIVFAILKSASDNKTTTQSAQPSAKRDATKAKLDYVLVHQDENNRVENYEIVIMPGTGGEAAALDVKRECEKPCNIFVYDTVEAQKLDREYHDISNGESAAKWKQDNYVYVADHLVGSIDFETGKWSAFPYRDWQYKELGGLR
jgi:hypothetical protein